MLSYRSQFALKTVELRLSYLSFQGFVSKTYLLTKQVKNFSKVGNSCSTSCNIVSTFLLTLIVLGEKGVRVTWFAFSDLFHFDARNLSEY